VIVTAECTDESGLTKWTVPYRHAVLLAKWPQYDFTHHHCDENRTSKVPF
jgi:hypothetical protein